MFTRDQIEEIKKKLIMLGTKDTQFPDAHKLNGEEIIAIVQDGENKKIPLSSIINDDFINVSKDTTEILTLSTAISKIDVNNRKLGQVITFKDSTNSWAIRQFTGSSLDNWNDISLWKSISGIDELKSQVETNAEDISVLSDEIERHDASILNLNTDVSKLKNKDIETSSSLSELNTKVDTLKSQADANTSNISSLNTEVSTLQSKVDENTTSISQINNNIADHEESITQINTKLEEHTESINAKITTDRIEDGAVTSEKIATSAFDSTLSVSGKIAPADVVGGKLTELDKRTSDIEHNNVETTNSIEITDDVGNAVVSVDENGVHLETISGFDIAPSIEIVKNNPTENNITFEDNDGNAVVIVNKKGLWAKKVTNGEHVLGEADYPMTFLPSTIYGIVGMPQRLYIRGICGGIDPYIYYNKFGATNLSSVSNSAKVYRRYAEITPSAVGTCEISHCLMDDKMVSSKPVVASYVVKNAPTSIPTQTNILCVGASTTAGGKWVKEVKRMLTGAGSRPSASTLPSEIGLGLNNINFVGRLFKNGVNLEATGGWTWHRYITNSNVSFRVQVQNQLNVVRGDVYSVTGTDGTTIRLTIAEENLTEGTGNILLNKNDGYTNNVPVSGTLTKVSGAGQATIPYTDAVEESYCPFYNTTTNQVDFAQYADAYCNGSIDVCVVFLTPYNSGVTGNESLDGVMADAATFVSALKRDFPNCKVVLVPNIGINVSNGIEYNDTLSGKKTTCSVRRMLFRYAQLLNEYAKTIDGCYIVNSMCEVDQDNAFPVGNRVVNYRSNYTEVIGTNGVHPTDTGYLMLADSVFRCLCHII